MRASASLHRTALALSLLVACGGDDDGSPPADAGGGTDAGAAVCSDDSDCSDGAFCTGEEACNPDNPAANAFGCLPGAPPCLGSQTCDDVEDRCVSDCGAAPDADGDGSLSLDCGGDDCDDADADRYPGNAEVCDEDAHDEDCDSGTFGDRDEDEDGEHAAVCCNVDRFGDRTCGRDCDDTSPSVNSTTSEVCDGVDNDCDGEADEGFECTPGETRACTVCSRVGEGMQACEASVCAWGACVAEEACNACDDDNDMTIDEGFMCVRGAVTACTNDCGTAAVGNCSMTCDGVDSCLTPSEVCNYCDDDGDGTHDDELAVAMSMSNVRLNCMASPSLPPAFNSVEVTLEDATCRMPGGNLRLAEVLDTTARADSGAIRYAVPMGYGRLTAQIWSRWANGALGGSSGGWAIVFIAEGRLTRTTSGVGYDRAAVTRGLAIEWTWNGNAADGIRVVRLNGTGTGTEMDTAVPDAFQQYGGNTTRIQTLYVEYVPQVMGRTPGSSDLRIRHAADSPSALSVFNGVSLMGELRPGDTIDVVGVAGETSSVTTGGFTIGIEGVAGTTSYLAQDQLCTAWL